MADLTTWLTVKNRLSLTDDSQTDVERYITVASVRAEQHTRRTLAAATDTFILDGTGTQILDVQQWPINSVTSVFVDYKREFASGAEITDYTIRSSRGHLLRTPGWPRGTANVKVTANVGYATVPADLEESIIQLVGYWLDSPSISWMSPQAGGDAAAMATNYIGVMDLPFQVRNVWDHYKRVLV